MSALLWLHTTETEVGSPRVDRAFASRSRQIGCAILIGAEKRPPALDALGDAGLSRIVAGRRPLRVHDGIGPFHVVAGSIPVGTPLPDVPRRVIKSEPIGRKRGHGCNPDEP